MASALWCSAASCESSLFTRDSTRVSTAASPPPPSSPSAFTARTCGMGLVFRYEGLCSGVGVYGIVGSWVHGFMGLWVYGFMGFWVYGFMGLWVYGFMGLWVYGLGFSG